MKLLILLVIVALSFSQNWDKIDLILREGINDKVFPGCVAIVGSENRKLYSKAFGRFRYDDISPRVSEETIFDLASLTKVLTSTISIAQLFQKGQLNLDEKVSSIFPEFSSNGKGQITIRHLLLHNSGLPAGPTPFTFFNARFGCPESQKPKPQLAFSCQQRIFEATMNQTLRNPVGQVYVYSDLSMIVLQYMIGNLAKKYSYVLPGDLIKGCDQGGKGSEQCYFEAYVRKYIFEKLGMRSTSFSCPNKDICPPGWIENGYRNELIHGYVSDGNAYALGGVAGHAGMFSSANDIFKMLQELMFTENLWNSKTRELFTKVHNTTQSARALGFDTNINGSCGSLSPLTYTHTGYFGTQICLDPVRKMFTLLFSNRVFPDPSNTKIIQFRRVFGTEVQKIFDQSR